MSQSISATMKAAAIDQFGGPEVIHIEPLPVPKPRADEITIRLDAAGVGVWDPYVREGEFQIGEVTFPLVLGNDGAGTVAAVGANVKRFRPGDPAYAYSMKGGFYAEYVAVSEENAAPVPSGLQRLEAGALGADGITALRGLDDQLHLRAGEKLMIYGASGGIGHLAVQLAKRLGAEVLAIASQADGVALVRRLGADAAVDGRSEDVAGAIRSFAPDGLDAALVTAGGERVDQALQAMKKGGRVAYPNGVEPEPRPPAGVTSISYDGTPSPDAFQRLNSLIERGPFHVELGRIYPLQEAAQAHRDLEKHHLGKVALRMSASGS
jgi:NADPH:quinone reductase-like Zn-dependent oxidoreductase